MHIKCQPPRVSVTNMNLRFIGGYDSKPTGDPTIYYYFILL